MNIIVANWKMNLNVPESSAYFVKLSELITDDDGAEIVLCPTFLALQTLHLQNNANKFKLGSQNCNALDSGPLTGEVSAKMLAGIVDYVIVGHSERRCKFGETDHDVNQKIKAVLGRGLIPILCIGERQNESIEETLQTQLNGGLSGIRSDQISQVVIAYEPVYAIGSRQIPTMGEIAHAVQIIQSHIASMFGVNAEARIIYGGSVDDSNAIEILSIAGVDGLLVGRASLDAVKFARIVKEVRIARGK